ncbi:hypothetical protein [Methanobrevibacter sp. DSM 116169]|uniref:hypothetical protein n=1 Tax=Methanobrevibacter sp. DSM 116169 TaxID=3242727 RepID=UPI0038FCF946
MSKMVCPKCQCKECREHYKRMMEFYSKKPTTFSVGYAEEEMRKVRYDKGVED